MRELTRKELEAVSGAGKDGPGREGNSKNGEPNKNNNTNRPGDEGQ
jgi:hypothetical protein